jgi:hypothetical protein
VEEALARVLSEHGPASLPTLDAALCAAFPGLNSPPPGLLRALLESYAEPASGPGGLWRLRSDQTPAALAASARAAQEALHRLAALLRFQSSGSDPLLWRGPDGRDAYAFYIRPTGQISDVLLGPSSLPAERCALLFPAARTALLRERLLRDPRLQNAVESGWRFLKFETLRDFAEETAPTLERWEELLAAEGRAATQMQMF